MKVSYEKAIISLLALLVPALVLGFAMKKGGVAFRNTVANDRERLIYY
jgi:hypothetical protein